MGAIALAVTGWGVLSPVGTGADEFSAGLNGAAADPADVRDLFGEPMPCPAAYAMPAFDVREHLGRKGTRHLDRSTALAVTTAGLALADADLTVGDDDRDEVGVVLGTTLGSLRATAEFDRETLINERPYLVEPVLFPTAVMNCAASRCAIWYGLGGANSTIAGGQAAAVAVLRYGSRLVRRGRARVLLLGAVEELSAQRAWAEHHAYAQERNRLPLGEAAVVLTAEDAAVVRAAGRHLDAEILAVEAGHFPGAGRAAAEGLAGRIAAALEAAGCHPREVVAVATGERGVRRLDDVEHAAVGTVLGPDVRRLAVKRRTGECGSASGMLQIAAVLARHRADPSLDGAVSVVTTYAEDGGVGAVVLRAFSRAEARHGA